MQNHVFFFFLIVALAFCSSIQIIGPLLDFAVISPACLSPRGEEGLCSLGLVGREMESIGNFLFQDSLCLQVIYLHRQASGRHQLSSVAAGEMRWNNVVWDFCPATVTAAKQRLVLPVVERALEPHGSALPSRGTGLPAPKARPTISLRLLSGRKSGFLTLDSHKNSSAAAEMWLCVLGITYLKIWTIGETFTKMHSLK